MERKRTQFIFHLILSRLERKCTACQQLSVTWQYLAIFWFPCASVSKRVSVKNHLNVNVSIFIQIQLIFIWEVLHLGFGASSIFLKIWFLKCSLHEEFSTLYLIIQGMLQLSPSFLQWNNYLSKCKVHFQTDGNNSAKMTEVRWFRFSPSCLLFFFFFFVLK